MMSISQTPFLLFGLSTGLIAAEAACWAVGPFTGGPKRAPPARTLLAMFAIFGSVSLLALLANVSQDTTPDSYWVDAIGACLAGQVWLTFKIFAVLTTGRRAKVLRVSVLIAHLLAGAALLALMVAVFLPGVGSSLIRTVAVSVGAAAAIAWVLRARTEYADGLFR
jgi:hypothetical protein